MDSDDQPEKNIVLVSGPAGSGKDTLIDHALEHLSFEKVVTTTSRPKRETESEGKPYYFLSPEEFLKRVQENKFVEYSQNENGAYYGVELSHLEEALAHQKKLIWKVDWKGIQNIKKIFPSIKSIGILANPESLEKRMRSREGSSYTEQYFQERIAYNQGYFDHADGYDYLIWNEDGQLEKSIEQFNKLLTEITGA